MSVTAPVALFGYNRADHLAETVRHLQANELADETDIYFFSDAPKDVSAEAGVRAVREFARGMSGFRSVTLIERETNWGLRRSLIDGVSQVAAKHGRVIVVEDDIATAPMFLHFMNSALEFYNDYETVGSISGYTAPYVTRKAGLKASETFFHYRTNCWGWATWWSRWRKADWSPSNWQAYFQATRTRKLLGRGGMDLPGMLKDSMEGRNQSWMARWYYNCFLHGMLTLYPGCSLVSNIGFDGSGVHGRNCRISAFRRYQTSLSAATASDLRLVLPVSVDDRIHRLMKRFWDPPWLRNSLAVQAIRPLYHSIRQACQRMK